MTDVFTVLAQDHQEVKAMLAELERGPTKATGATEDQLALRKKMTEQLIIEESRHEALEEMYFWPAVRDRLESGEHAGRRGDRAGAGRQAGAGRPGQARPGRRASSSSCSASSSWPPASTSSSRSRRSGR